jgi:hypothetical protein
MVGLIGAWAMGLCLCDGTWRLQVRNGRSSFASGSMIAILTLVMMTATTTPAAADERSVGSCSSRPYNANFFVNYAKTGDQTGDRIYSIGWNIGGMSESASRVEARIKYDNRLGHDPIYYTWFSTGPVATENTVDLRAEKIVVPANQRMYVEFKVWFDDFTTGSAPDCEGHTRNV